LSTQVAEGLQQCALFQVFCLLQRLLHCRLLLEAASLRRAPVTAQASANEQQHARCGACMQLHCAELLLHRWSRESLVEVCTHGYAPGCAHSSKACAGLPDLRAPVRSPGGCSCTERRPAGRRAASGAAMAARRTLAAPPAGGRRACRACPCRRPGWLRARRPRRRAAAPRRTRRRCAAASP